MKKLISTCLFIVAFCNYALLAQLPPGFHDNAPCPVRNLTGSWDWKRNVDYTVYLAGSRYDGYPGHAVPMPCPWFASRNPNYDKNNLNINDFRLQNPKDYEPLDGWVLIKKEFGEPGRLINHPYFILYNEAV